MNNEISFLSVESWKSNVLTYWNNVKKVWESRIERIRNSFSSMLSDEELENTLIFTTWSDWRMENKSFDWKVSNIELTFVSGLPSISKRVQKIIESGVSFIIDNIEHKVLWLDKIILYNNNPSN